MASGNFPEMAVLFLSVRGSLLLLFDLLIHPWLAEKEGTKKKTRTRQTMKFFSPFLGEIVSLGRGGVCVAGS